MPRTRNDEVRKICKEILDRDQDSPMHDSLTASSFMTAAFMIQEDRNHTMALASVLEQMMYAVGGEPSGDLDEVRSREERILWTDASKLLKGVQDRTGISFGFTGSFLHEGDITVEDKLDAAQDDPEAA